MAEQQKPAQNKPAEASFYCHPIYSAELTQLQESHDLYAGNQDTMREEKYLTPYGLETDTQGTKNLAQRKKRTFYTNYYKALAKLNVAYIFCVEPNLSEFVGEGKLFTEEEAKNIDGRKTSLLDFIKRIATYSILYPRVYISVDAPPVKASSQKQVIDQKLRPYGFVFEPLEIPDWLEEESDFARFGELVALHRQYNRIAGRKKLDDKPDIELVRDQYSILNGKYERTTYRLKKENKSGIKIVRSLTNFYQVTTGDVWELIGAVEADWLKKLPIVVSAHEPWLAECNGECLRLHNLISSFENILYYQGYTHIAISGDPAQNSETVSASENSIIWLNKDATITNIPAENAEGLRQRIDEVRNTIFRLGLNQLRMLDASSKSVQSAETQYADKEDRNVQIQSKVHEIEDSVNNFFELWALFKNQPPPKTKFKIEARPTAQDRREFLEFYQQTLDIQDEVPSFEKFMIEKMIKLLDADAQQQLEMKADLMASITAKRGRLGTVRQREGAAATDQNGQPAAPPPGTRALNPDKFLAGFEDS